MEVRSKFFDPSRVRPSRKKNSGDVWIRLVPWAYLVIAALVVTLGVAVFWPVFKESSDLQTRKTALLADIEKLKQDRLQLEQERDALTYNKSYIERKARDTLNYGKPGEVIFKFPPYSE